MITALILARGGSKGLPRKNVRQLSGKPLITRCVATCREVCERVLVSTDDAEIATLAEAAGAEVIERPDELATDTATSWEVVRHAIGAADITGTLAMVQCTAPFLHADDILGCAELIGTHDLATTVLPTHQLLVNAWGSAINWSTSQTLRQQRPTQYRLTGSCWAFATCHAWQDQYSGRIGIHLARHPYQIDIDTLADLELCQAIELFRTIGSIPE